MIDDLHLNVPLLRRRVPNLTAAAKAAGLRPATVSNLCTGKIPVGRAEVRTVAILAALAGCTMDELVIRGAGAGVLETGIKALDLFAPLVRGGTAGAVARPGMGQLVLLAELFRRIGRQRGYATVLWRPKEESAGVEDAVREAEAVCASMEETYAAVCAARDSRDVLLGADREVVLSGELQTLRERLREAGARPVTIVLVDTRGESMDEDVPYGPLDTLWKFDADLAARHLFPAVDPVGSTSTVLEGAQLEAAHLTVQQRARKTLRRYRELRALARAWGAGRIPEAEQTAYRQGERLEAFLSQPFYVAEPFTNRPGEWTPLADTLDGVRRILDGAADGLEPEALTYIGRLALGPGDDAGL
ncbi:hypothetical protein [Paenibacillus flagellatus]|uniref:F-type H+-transporting ATPase subunit beta n=1 Tax=Paenibacillus flagellatus TaxID=2211139 RepID=A0A2V5KCY9_9BACL|nr:hypothetical protein [Paenibacillus flagellatus]PYI57519.1 hypothetical protein DLM86_03565 [Paenibacillus flagellatus]